MGLFSTKRAPPPTVPTDDVTPLRFVDELYPVSFDFTLIFQDAMDSETLRASADRLLQREGWRQLGARLRRTVWLLVELNKLRNSILIWPAE